MNQGAWYQQPAPHAAVVREHNRDLYLGYAGREASPRRPPATPRCTSRSRTS